MKIFRIILLEYILGYILQGFAYCLGIYAFSIKKIDKKYITASTALVIISYIMRLLPVSFGLHTILILVCLFFLAIFYLKIPAFSVIKSIVAITVLLLMTELISVLCITGIVGQAQFDNMMNDVLGRAILAVPSTLIFTAIVVCAYFILRKIKEKKRAENGEGGK